MYDRLQRSGFGTAEQADKRHLNNSVNWFDQAELRSSLSPHSLLISLHSVAEFRGKSVCLALFFCQKNLYEPLNVPLWFAAVLVPRAKSTWGGKVDAASPAAAPAAPRAADASTLGKVKCLVTGALETQPRALQSAAPAP